MKAAVTDGKGKVWIDSSVPIPKINEYQCLCKTNACATCTGTDIKIIDGKLLYVPKYPAILGHESVGTVIECGKKVRNIKLGERFLRCSAVYQGEKLGDFYSGFGAFAQYSIITDSVAFKEDNPNKEPSDNTILEQKVPDSISDIDATILITLKEAASYVATMGIKLRQSLLLLGTGSVGLSMLRFAKIFGAYPVIVAGRRDEALQGAESIGADFLVNITKEDIFDKVNKITNKEGVDFILDTTGSLNFLENALSSLNKNGKVAPYATYISENNSAEAYNIVTHKNLTDEQLIKGGPNEALAHEYLLDAVRLSLINPSNFYSHVMEFDDITQGFEMLKKKEAFKIVFKI